MKRDYYEVLGLERTASDDDIKKAYRRLANKYHPDKLASQSPEAQKAGEESFKEAKEAYEALSDTSRRAAYDRFGHNSPNSQHNHYTSSANMEDMLREMFGNGSPFGDLFGTRTHTSSTSNRKFVTISLETAYTGTIYKDNDVNIRLPAGIRDGSRFIHNTTIYTVKILPHAKFKRSMDDLLVDTEITAIEAMLGIDAGIAHLDGTVLQFTIPAGIQAGQVVRLAGRGMMNPETSRSGDLHIRISISTPNTLTDEQRDALKSFNHRTSFTI